MSCSGSPLTRAFNFHTYPLSQPCPVSFIFRSTSHGVFRGCLHNRRAVVIYCLRHMQVARKYFNNGEKRGKSACFRGKLKNPPPPHISVLKIKRYGTGLAQVKIGMEAPGNRLLAVHLPVSAICVIKDKVVNKRNEWVDKCFAFKRQHIDIFHEFENNF